MRFPNELKYTKDHEWAKIDGNQVTVGITDHAQSSLGDIVFVELPKVGRELKAGETFGVVESIKAVSDLYSPIAGKVVAVNDHAVSEPSSLNTWIRMAGENRTRTFGISRFADGFRELHEPRSEPEIALAFASSGTRQYLLYQTRQSFLE
jgi:glycine cleavage system H protein